MAFAAVCAGTPMHARMDRRLPAGTWGGDHVAVTVSAGGAHFEFDCASGEISSPLVVNDDGRLAMEGVFAPEPRGARRQGEVPAKQSARFTGQLRNTTLAFDITLVNLDGREGATEKVGSFIATLDATPVLRKCR